MLPRTKAVPVKKSSSDEALEKETINANLLMLRYLSNQILIQFFNAPLEPILEQLDKTKQILTRMQQNNSTALEIMRFFDPFVVLSEDLSAVSAEQLLQRLCDLNANEPKQSSEKSHTSRQHVSQYEKMFNAIVKDDLNQLKKELQLFLEKQADDKNKVNEIRNGKGDTLLIAAVRANRKNIVNYLLNEMKVDVSIISPHDNKTAYMAAVNLIEIDTKDSCESLLLRKCCGDVSFFDLVGKQSGPSLDSAYMAEGTARLFVSTNTDVTHFNVGEYCASDSTFKRAIQLYLTKNREKNSAEAFKSKHVTTNLQNLLIKYQNPNEVKPPEVNTALRRAAFKNNNNDVADLLEKYGADINSKSSNGFSAVQWAYYNGSFKTLNLLASRKASDYEQLKSLRKYVLDTENELPPKDEALRRAAAKGNIDDIKMLVETYQANILAEDENGMTPLSLAQKNGHNEAVQVLNELNKAEKGKMATKQTR